MKKKLLMAFAALVVLVVVGLVVVVSRLDSLIKQGVETIGPKVTKVDVKLDEVKLRLLGGSGELKGLQIGNPPGYKSEAAMKIGELNLSLVPRSLFADKIHVKTITIVAPEITIEGGLKDNNLAKILANVEEYTGPADTNETETASAQKKLQVDSFVVRGATVNASLDVLGGQPLSYTLPDFELANLGQGPEGITGSELTKRVLDVIIKKALNSVAEQGTKLGKQALDAAAQGAQEAIQEKAKQGISDLLKIKP